MEDLTFVLNDYLDNQSIGDNFEHLEQMADDYKCKLLMESLAEDLNS